MTEIHIPYLPSAKFFKVLYRLGVHEQDISSDTDSNPQIRTIGRRRDQHRKFRLQQLHLAHDDGRAPRNAANTQLR